MSVPNFAMWCASAVASAWKGSQLVRLPEDKGLRVITACSALVLLALTAQLAAGSDSAARTTSDQLPKLFQNVVLTFFFALLIILLQSMVDSEAVGSHGPAEVAIAFATSCGLIAAFAAADTNAAGFSYEYANSAAALLFYLIGNLYMAYATMRGANLARYAADQAQSRVRLSLLVAGAGLVVCCLGTHVPRIVSTSSRLVFQRDAIPGTAAWTTPVLAIGIAVFFLGIGYPGVRTGLVKTRLWFRDRKRYRQLWPLWSALHHAFPDIALLPPSSPVRDALRVRHMRLHFYRRVIECRDGLVCVSPYLDDEPIGSGSPMQSAHRLREALHRSVAGKPSAGVSVVAEPTESGTEADITQLLELARSLRTD